MLKITIGKQWCLLLFAMFLATASYAQAPTISSFSPTKVTYRTSVSIQGSNFTSAMASNLSNVKFNGVNAVEITYVSSSQIKAVVPQNAGSGTIKVTTTGGTVTSASTFTFIAAEATPQVAKVTQIITDWNGYWNSSTTSSNAANQPDLDHNLCAFKYNNTLYSTGNESQITSVLQNNGAGPYTVGNFRALPINNLEGSIAANASNPTLLVMASKIDGSATSTVLSSNIAGRTIRDVLIDGFRGLDIGTGVTNVPSSAVMLFQATNIVADGIDDNIPDILVTQIATPSSSYDVYSFVDANGNIVGNPVQVQFTSSIPSVGTYKSDFFSLTNTSLNTATPTQATYIGDTTRELKLVAYKLSDFGINPSNKDQAVYFKVMPSGTSDMAFMAYNRNTFQIPSPEIVSQTSSQVVCPGGTATFTVNVASPGTETVYQWRKNGVNVTNSSTISGANSATLTISPVALSDAGTYTCLITNPSGATISEPIYFNATVQAVTTEINACFADQIAPTIEVTGSGLNLHYQWYSNNSNSNTGGTAISGATSSTYTPSQFTVGTKYYYAEVYNTGFTCTTTKSAPIKVTVDPAVSAGTISSDQSICAGNTVNLTITGYSGNIHWQTSPNGVNNWADVTEGFGSTTATYTTQPLTTTSYYRAFVISQNGGCSEASDVSTVVVNESTTWIGAISTDWNTGGNWSCGNIPTTYNDVIIPVAPQNQPVISGTASGKSVTLENGASLLVKTGGTLHVVNAINSGSSSSFEIENNGALVQDNNVANTGQITMHKKANPLFRLDYTFWSSPVTGQNLQAFSPLTLSNRFYTYGIENGEDAYIQVADPASESFQPGVGYLIRMPNKLYATAGGVPITNDFLAYNAGTYQLAFDGVFTGVPNNGDVTVQASTTDMRSNGVGNPYPSPISLVDFYLENSNVLRDNTGVYFWRKKNDGSITSYATLTLMGFVANGGAPDTGGAPTPGYQYGGQNQAGYYTGNVSNWVIAPGQGFYVKTSTSPSTTDIVFKNSMRRATPGANQGFFRDGNFNTISRLWLNITDTQNGFNQIIVGYKDDATLGMDYGYDGSRMSTSTNVSLYSLAEGNELTIQARPAFENTDVVPVGYVANNAGNFTLAIDHTDGIFEDGQDIYIKDNLLGVTHDIKAEAYTFTSEAGTFDNRFEIVYMAGNSLGTDTPFDANTVIVYKQDGNININAGQAVMTSVNIYDIHGRVIYTANNVNDTHTVLSGLRSQEQMIIVEINSDKGKVSKKLIF
ncbi:immunoglobulin domain-containing protein [Flavobacterium rhizosphaerae]|uniref:Immunoglobulin domain-containing protein n=1 Tax=Flavobacterium rhizosphaerae TaxID=3163298 RepID=A0ABW8YSG1_9FLAO